MELLAGLLILERVVAHLALGCGCAGKAPVGQGVDCTARGSSCAQAGRGVSLCFVPLSHTDFAPAWSALEVS